MTDQSITESILKRAGGLAGSDALGVQMMQRLDKKTATVLFQTSRSVRSMADLDRSVASAYNNKVSVLPESAHRPNPERPDLVLCIVELNQEKKAFVEESSLKGMTVVAANIFRDENDKIWQKVGEGEEALLIKKSDDDLDAILSARRSLSIATASVSIPLSEPYSVGSMIGFYDTVSQKMRYGTAVDETLAYDLESGKMATLNPKQVMIVGPSVTSKAEIAAYGADVFNRGEPVQMTRDEMITKLQDYMAILYNRNSVYYKKMIGLLRTKFGAAQIPSF